MHLAYKSSRYKNKMYKYYFLSVSYREGKKVRKRDICKLGKLTELQVRQIRRILKVTSDPKIVLASLDDIKIQNIKTFGDIAVANALWEEWKISQAFKYNQTNSHLSTEIVARILTLNRCISPCSHYSIPQWLAQTALSEITKLNLEYLNDDKIYYELDKIDQNHEFIEEHLFSMTYQKNKKNYDYVNYDLSSSYFVGLKCKLSHYVKRQKQG